MDTTAIRLQKFLFSFFGDDIIIKTNTFDNETNHQLVVDNVKSIDNKDILINEISKIIDTEKYRIYCWYELISNQLIIDTSFKIKE